MTDQKVPSPLSPDQRRRMREAAETVQQIAPAPWCTGKKGAAGVFHGFHGVTCGTQGEDSELGALRVMLTANPNYPVEPISRYVVETQPSAVLALLDALEQAERERDELRERLAVAERPREALRPMEWADVLAAEARVDDLLARGVTGEELTKAETEMRIAKAAWGLDAHQRAAR